MSKGDEILRRLSERFDLREEEYASLASSKSGNPFEVIIATVISQNTNDKNTMRVMMGLRERFGSLNPEKLLEIPIEDLEEILRPAGLYKQKAKYLKRISEELRGGRLTEILRESNTEEIRRKLMGIPGIGPKTADVLLSLLGRETIAVDRHIARVSLRLGIAKDKNYESIRESLMKIFDKNDYFRAHLLLIKLGRTYCRPRNPKCSDCPLRDICDYSHLLKPGDSDEVHSNTESSLYSSN